LLIARGSRRLHQRLGWLGVVSWLPWIHFSQALQRMVA
jgi:hypothetical protein